MHFKRPSIIVIILFAILLLGGFLRIYGLRTAPPGLYPDEAVNGNNSIEATSTGEYKVFYPENGGREGLFINVQALSYKIFQQNEPWVLRFPSTLFGILTILGLYFLITALATQAGWKHASTLGLIGAFLIATSVWHIIFSRIGLRVISAPCFAVWTSYFCVQSGLLKSKKHAVVAGILLGLGFYTYTAFRVFPFILLTLLPLFRKQWRTLLYIFIPALLCVLPLLFYYFAHPFGFSDHTQELSVLNTPHPWQNLWDNIVATAQMFHIQGDLNWRHNLSGNPELFWPVGLVFGVGIVIALLRRTLFDSFFLVWLLLAAIPVVFSYPGVPHALRALLMIPAVLALAARGTHWLYEHTRTYLSEANYAVIIIVMTAFLTYQATIAYFLVWAPSPEVAYAFTTQYQALADQINALPPSTSKTVVETFGDLTLCYPTICVQSVMFLTNSYLPDQQAAKHIKYITPTEYEAQKDTLTGAVFFLN